MAALPGGVRWQWPVTSPAWHGRGQPSLHGARAVGSGVPRDRHAGAGPAPFPVRPRRVRHDATCVRRRGTGPQRRRPAAPCREAPPDAGHFPDRTTRAVPAEIIICSSRPNPGGNGAARPRRRVHARPAFLGRRAGKPEAPRPDGARPAVTLRASTAARDQATDDREKRRQPRKRKDAGQGRGSRGTPRAGDRTCSSLRVVTPFDHPPTKAGRPTLPGAPAPPRERGGPAGPGPATRGNVDGRSHVTPAARCIRAAATRRRRGNRARPKSVAARRAAPRGSPGRATPRSGA